MHQTHSNILMSFEHKQIDYLASLDVLIRGREDDTIQRSVHRKGTWVDQYIHFYSFAPNQHKLGLVRNIFNHARKSYKIDTLQDELEKCKHTLIFNGYPAQFLEHQGQLPRPSPTISKMKIVIHLTLGRDD